MTRLGKMIVIWLFGLCVAYPVLAQNNTPENTPDNTQENTQENTPDISDTTPPDILDVSDPFSRDLNRASDQITGGINFDGSDFSTSEHAGTGRDLLGRDIQTALTSSQFRVAGLAVRKHTSPPHIYERSVMLIEPGERPIRPYLRLGVFDNPALARQAAINLIDAYGDILDTTLIIRIHDDSTYDANEDMPPADLDIGPFRHQSHAKRFCTFLTYVTDGSINDCYHVEEYAHYDDDDGFGSLALMRLATDTVSNQVVNPDLFNLPATASTMLVLKEGDRLGTGSNMITKIIETGIFMVDDVGQISHLPYQFIPETPLPPETEAIDLPDLSAINFDPLGINDDDLNPDDDQEAEPNIAEQLLELE